MFQNRYRWNEDEKDMYKKNTHPKKTEDKKKKNTHES